MIFKLKEEVCFQDGNSVEKGTKVKIIKKEDGLVQLETIDEHNMKRVFWSEEKNLKRK
jgi:hypothetical protein